MFAQHVLDKVEIITQSPLAEMQANEEQQGNLLQEYEQRFEKLSEDQKSSRLCSEVRLSSRKWTILLCSSITKKRSISLFMPRTRIKGRIQCNVRFGPVSDIKVCNENGRYRFEVQVQSLFQDQAVSWIRIESSIDKIVREAMPIQEEKKASGKPAAKARPILKPSSTSGWDTIPIEQRKWMDIGTQESNDSCCFQDRNS